MFNLEAIMLAYQKLTVIHWLVVKLEGLFPGKGAGPTKLDILLNTVQSGAADVATAATEANSIKTIASATVGEFNKSGWPDPATLPPLANFSAPVVPSGANNLASLQGG